MVQAVSTSTDSTDTGHQPPAAEAALSTSAAGGVPTIEFGVPEALDAERRMERLARRMPGNWRVQAEDRPRDNFSAKAWHADDLIVVSGEYPQREIHRTLPMIRADQIDHYALALPLDGETLEVRSSSRSEVAGCGQPLMTDYSQELSVKAHGGNFLLALVPREAIDDLLPRPLDLHVTPLSGGATRLLVSHMRSFVENLPSMEREEAKVVAAATIHLLVASLANCPDVAAVGRKGTEAALLRQACRYVELHLKEPEFGAAEIGAAMKISRASVYRLFERFGGVSKFIKERRLIRIHSELAERRQNRGIGLIADEFGYANAAQFSRAFRDQFGYSPRDVGSVLPTSIPKPESPAEGPDTFASWVRGLRA